MSMPPKARFKVVRFTMLAASALLAACAGEATAPVASTTRGDAVVSPFVPSAAARSLVGISDGTYTFDVDPSRNQALVLGANYLSLPANAICDISTSNYGPAHWDEACSPERNRVTITAVVKQAKSAHPSIDFYPAMRFSPSANVSLYMYVPPSERKGHKDFVMKYCNDQQVCVDESLTDRSLVTQTDRSNKVVFRRIKHFSGYIVAFATDILNVL